jgi:hypoxanthine phosphoribosyltransferase
MGPATLEEMAGVQREADLLHSAEAVEAAFDQMAAAVSRKLHDRRPLVLAVMIGGIIPAGRLVPRLNFPLELDYIHATRYRGDVRGGDLHWRAHPTISMQDRTVLVVDDILDEGLTLSAILNHCREQGAAEVLSAVLVEKHHDRKPALKHADFAGLTVEDRYVFGCGMDYKGFLRNAAGIYAVKGL